MNIKKYHTIMSIFKHWQWADWTKEEFEYHLNIDFPDIFNSQDTNIEFFLFNSSTGKCMLVWYSLLYAVCEGIKKLYKRDFNDNIVDIYKITPNFKNIEDDLRIFRNATFHVQDKYYTKKIS